jgi:hypothetical protein
MALTRNHFVMVVFASGSGFRSLARAPGNDRGRVRGFRNPPGFA